MKRKDFLIDVDGVAANLVPYLLKCLKSRYPEDKVPNATAVTGDLFEALCEKHQKYITSLMSTNGFADTLPLINGVRLGIRAIENAGHNIYWTTAPWQHGPTWDYDRRLWLKRKFGHGKQNVLFTHAKHLVSGSHLIDDTYKNVINWSNKQSGLGLLYKQPWNEHKFIKNKPKSVKLFTWEDIELYI